MVSWSNGNGPVNKSIHYVLYILLSLLRDNEPLVNLVLYKWFKKTLFVSYYTDMI